MVAKRSRESFECLNQPDKMQQYVEQRLVVWARWYAKGNGYGLGYPPCSIEYRLMREGIVRSSPAGLRPLPVNEPAEEMERFIQYLARQKPEEAKALRDYYLHYGSYRKQARALGASATQLQWQVEKARQWLCGWLSARLSGQSGWVEHSRHDEG